MRTRSSEANTPKSARQEPPPLPFLGCGQRPRALAAASSIPPASGARERSPSVRHGVSQPRSLAAGGSIPNRHRAETAADRSAAEAGSAAALRGGAKRCRALGFSRLLRWVNSSASLASPHHHVVPPLGNCLA